MPDNRRHLSCGTPTGGFSSIAILYPVGDADQDANPTPATSTEHPSKPTTRWSRPNAGSNSVDRADLDLRFALNVRQHRVRFRVTSFAPRNTWIGFVHSCVTVWLPAFVTRCGGRTATRDSLTPHQGHPRARGRSRIPILDNAPRDRHSTQGGEVSTIHLHETTTATPKVYSRGSDSTIDESAIVAVATVLALVLLFLVLAV
jgi:hypothetical protein